MVQRHRLSFLSRRNAKGTDPANAPDHHTPDFYIDDSMLYVGVKAFCNLVFDYAAMKTNMNKKSLYHDLGGLIG